MKRVLSLVAALATVFTLGCGGDDDATRSCTTSADCPTASACIAVDATRACTPTCSATVDDCGGTAECTGVGASSIDVCQPMRDPTAPPEPADEPIITCATDGECQVLADGDPAAVCGSWQGTRRCTRRCAGESDCQLPPAGGVVLDYLACGADEGAPDRMVCLPDPRCLMDPLGCVSVPG
ncbi:MAG: hypothetical protein KBG48_03770 [Kofleriaceae bacterium]|jgi:hypothetical protein|nr:hypothetical protein [Kofleriaceae bacterium]MBP9166474.1 hypothetical protein [Kofleriaceae bacterium]MBP9860295.1 hypothetical protein [Kofleriaceae bacterium]